MKSVMDVCLHTTEIFDQTDPIADPALATNQCRQEPPKKEEALTASLNHRYFSPFNMIPPTQPTTTTVFIK
jgi:hypothetical protein